MTGVRGLKPDQPKLQLISIERTESGREIWTLKHDPAPIRKKRNRAARGLMAVLAASLLLNAVQAVIIYVLQAGPI